MPYCYVTQTGGTPSIEADIGLEETARLSGDEAGATIYDAWWQDKISAAETEVNGYCGVKYTVPFEIVPDFVAEITRTIAIYKGYLARKTNPDWIRTRYEDAIERLREIAAGKFALTIDDEEEVEPAQPTTAFSAKERLFERDA